MNDFNHATKHDSNGKHFEINTKKLIPKYLIEEGWYLVTSIVLACFCRSSSVINQTLSSNVTLIQEAAINYVLPFIIKMPLKQSGNYYVHSSLKCLQEAAINYCLYLNKQYKHK